MIRIVGDTLQIESCPRCGVANPATACMNQYEEKNFIQRGERRWWTFGCRSCGGALVAHTFVVDPHNHVVQVDPQPRSDEVPSELPARAQTWLREAIRSARASAPGSSVIACASAVDAMLKQKGYRDGGLFSRIDRAAQEHVITEDMAQWAHQIRLDANDQRHVDDNAPDPTTEDATRCIEFAEALGEFLFVLPSKVTRGLSNAQGVQGR